MFPDRIRSVATARARPCLSVVRGLVGVVVVLLACRRSRKAQHTGDAAKIPSWDGLELSMLRTSVVVLAAEMLRNVTA